MRNVYGKIIRGYEHKLLSFTSLFQIGHQYYLPYYMLENQDLLRPFSSLLQARKLSCLIPLHLAVSIALVRPPFNRNASYCLFIAIRSD